MRKRSIKPIEIFYVILFIIILSVTGHELKLLHSEILIRGMLKAGIDYEAFRNIRIDQGAHKNIEKRVGKLMKKYPAMQEFPYMDTSGYLTFSMMASEYNLITGTVPEEATFLRGIARLSAQPSFQELYGYYKAVFSDLVYFPVPVMKKDAAGISYEDTWYVLRKYGGNRRHEGTDLMAGNNTRGYFPIISMTDGLVENMGWLEQGGYRIGIRAASGGYFYYAHLDSYAPGLKKGDAVIAGQLIGFMGDSGYGEEGTRGKFDVHLHMGIYVPSEIEELSVNPYWVLKNLERSRTQLEH